MDDRDLTPADLETLRHAERDHRTRNAGRLLGLGGFVVSLALAACAFRDLHADWGTTARHDDALSATRAVNRRLEKTLTRVPDLLLWTWASLFSGLLALGDLRARRRDALLLKLAGRRLDALR